MSSAPATLTNPRAELIARLLRGENRENLTEQEALAMGDTILNRTGLRGYPATPEEVIQQNRNGRYQYSPMNPGSRAYREIMEFGPAHPEWQQYISYAEKILDPRRARSQFTHYFAGDAPSWASSLEGLTQIGSHWFGRENRKPKASLKENYR